MKRLSVALTLLVLIAQSALAQAPAPSPAPVATVRLKDAIKDFPRSQLQFKSNGPVSIETSQGIRASYQTLADMAGLDVIFDRDFRENSALPPRIAATNILDAFDLLSAGTGHFVEVLDSHSIVVSPDNATKHREYDVQVLKTFYPGSITTQKGLGEVVTALRTLLNARNLAIHTDANAIVMSDTPDRIAFAEKVIAQLDHPAAPETPVSSGTSIATNALGHLLLSAADGVHQSVPARSQLQALGVGSSQSFKMNDDSRTTFETLAKVAGLNVMFDPDFRSIGAMPFSADNVDALEALDLLSLQTGSFWQVLDSKTIIVAPDNQTKRRNLQPLFLKTFYLPKNSSPQAMTEIVTAIRSVLNFRYIAIVPTTNAITLREVPNRLALAEQIITDLTKSTGGVAESEAVASGVESPSINGEVEPKVVKTISLPNLSPVGVIEIVTSLRTLLNLRQVEAVTNSIVIQDTANKVALAEKLVADLLKP